MGFFKKLFVKKPRIYFIEINDEDIDNKLSAVLSSIRSELDTFKKTVSTDTIEGNEAALLHLQQLLMKAKSDLKSISLDVDKILSIELENKSFFAVKDESFLNDKREQISKMLSEIDSFIGVIEQRPSKEALQSELLDELLAQADTLRKNLESLIADDAQLKAIYKKINDL